MTSRIPLAALLAFTAPMIVRAEGGEAEKVVEAELAKKDFNVAEVDVSLPGLANEVTKRLADLNPLLADVDSMSPDDLTALLKGLSGEKQEQFNRLMTIRGRLGARPALRPSQAPSPRPGGESLGQELARGLEQGPSLGGARLAIFVGDGAFDGAALRDAPGAAPIPVAGTDFKGLGLPRIQAAELNGPRGASARRPAGRGGMALLGPTERLISTANPKSVPGGPGGVSSWNPASAARRALGAFLSAVPEGIGSVYQGFQGTLALVGGTGIRILGWGVEKGGEGVSALGTKAGLKRLAAAGDWVTDKGLVTREAGSLTAGEGVSLTAGSAIRGFNAAARLVTSPFSDAVPLDPTKGRLKRAGGRVVDVFTDPKFKDLEPDYAARTFAESHSSDALADKRLRQAAAWGGGWGFYTTAAALANSAGEKFTQAVGTFMLTRQLPASQVFNGLALGAMGYGSIEQYSHHKAEIAKADTAEKKVLTESRAAKSLVDLLAALLGARTGANNAGAAPPQSGAPAPHEVLGVNAAASEGEVLAAFRDLAKRSHPDVNPGNPNAAELFRSVKAARDEMIAAIRKRDAGASGRGPADASDTTPAASAGTPAVGAPAPPLAAARPRADAAAAGAAVRALRLRKMAEAVPPQVYWAGQTWDVEGVGLDGKVRLEREGTKDAFYPLPLLGGTPIRYRGISGKVEATTQETITLRLNDGSEKILSGKELAGEPGQGLTFIKGGRELMPRAVDADGTARLTPAPPAETPAAVEVPLAVFGAVPVRLKGREDKGLFKLGTDLGRLTATPAGPASGVLPQDVTPDQVVGRHVELESPEFGKIHVDSRLAALDRRATGAERSPSEPASAAPVFGALVGGKTMVGPGDAVLNGMVEQVGKAKGPLNLSLFELDVSDDGSAPADKLLDALIAHSLGNGPSGVPQPVRIVYNPVRPLDPRVTARLAAAKKAGADIELVVPRQVSNDIQSVNHSKTLAGGDVGYLMTGGLSAKAAGKVELGVALPAPVARQMNEYLGLLAAPGSNTAHRRAAAEGLARQGVVVNDPLLPHGGYLTQAVNGLLQGAKKSLQVYVKELKDVASTQTLIDKARAGVRVGVAIRNNEGIGEKSREMVRKALEENPDLPLTLNVYPKSGGPLPHGNLIVADGSRAYLGTAFLWTSHMSGVMPGGRAFDHGVLLEGGDAARVHQQFRDAVPAPETSALEPEAAR